MDFFVNNDRRPGLAIAHIIDALQRFEEGSGQLSLEIAQRYSDPPPPYSSSGETTQLPSPAEAPDADEAALQARRSAMFRSTPRNQFDSQTRRETERIKYQIQKERFGRRQTLPYDDKADLEANADNNVRARWVEQGIWKEEWGPAWPKGAKPSDNHWHYSHKNTRGPYICTIRWGHEKRPEPQFLPEPAPEPEAKPTRNIFAGLVRNDPDTTTEEPAHASAPDVTEAPAATSERDTSASRPYHQFLYQVSKEREWVSDELQFEPATGTIDIDAMAYESTKKNWIKDGIWNSAWGELPGKTWMHEDLLDELEDDKRRTSKPQPDAACDDDQTPHPPSPRSFNSEPTPSVFNDGTNSHNLFMVPEEAGAPSGGMAIAGSKKKRAKGTSRLFTANKSLRSTDVPGDRVLRSVRSAKVMKPSMSRAARSKDTSSAPRAKQASTERPVRTARRPSLGLAELRMSKTKSKREQQQRLHARAQDTTLQLPSTGALNKTGQRRPTAKDQPITTQAPRRSERIAAQTPKTSERERRTAAPSTGESKGRPRPTVRAISPTTDSGRIRKRKCNANEGIHTKLRSRF